MSRLVYFWQRFIDLIVLLWVTAVEVKPPDCSPLSSNARCSFLNAYANCSPLYGSIKLITCTLLIFILCSGWFGIMPLWCSWFEWVSIMFRPNKRPTIKLWLLMN